MKPPHPRPLAGLRARWSRLCALSPVVWSLVRPRIGLLAGGFALLAVGRLCGLALPVSTKFLVDDVLGRGRTDLLFPLIAGVVAATAIQGFTTFTLIRLLSKAAQRLIAELRLRLHAHVLHLPVTFYDGQKSGAVVSRVMHDVEGVRNLLGTGLVEMLGGLLAAAFALALMLRISLQLTLVAAVAAVASAAVVLPGLRHLISVFKERGRLEAEVAGRLTETVGGVRVVKGYQAEEREHRVFGQGVGRLLDNVLRTLDAVAVMGLGSHVLLGLGGGAVLYVGARQILAGELTLGELFAFTLLLGFVVTPLLQAAAVGSQLTEALAGLERTQEVLRERREDADPARVVAIGPLKGEIVFDDVRFAYRPDTPVLHGISFRAEPGTVTALVGPSGAGKSTVASLVAGFHVPTAGRITVDGADLSTAALHSYRHQLGLVLQDTFLFEGTIAANVAFARPDAGEGEVRRACRLARVDEFAEAFEEGYETLVGERGVRLSGGQRQRVSLARAILADPRILVLDEATSSLDTESEALIQEALAHLLPGRTTIVIAHRLSTIRRADQILVMDAGRIVERGTHAALLALKGRYFDMYTRQHGVEANLFLAPGEGRDGAGKANRATEEAEGSAVVGPSIRRVLT